MKVFIGCVKLKNKGKMKAKDKYKSPLFKKELAYARKIAPDTSIYILSAKYGIITLEDIIDDYDLTLNKCNEIKRKEWAYSVIKKTERLGISKNEEIIFLCGNNYSKYLKKYFTNYKDPTFGLSLGNTLKWYNKNI